MNDQKAAAPDAEKPAAEPAAGGEPEETPKNAAKNPEKPQQDLAHEVGGFTAGAANNPNKSSDHLGYQQAAQQQLFGSIQDAVMGDKHVGAQFFFGGGDTRTRMVLKLSAHAVDEANAFVRSDDYERIARFAKERNLVVLTGPPGSGRGATALHLLVAETGRQSVHEIHGDTDLGTLSDEPLPRGTGIIMHDISVHTASLLDEFALRRLGDTLTSRGQKLIIGAAESTTWGCGTVGATHTVPIGTRADARAVLECQLRWRLGPARAAKADGLLARTDVGEVVAGHLGPARPLGDAARLAAILADASATPESAAVTARLSMTIATETDFEAWFDGLAREEDERDQCYAIALAVLHGLSNEKVAQAGKLLERFLAPETPRARDESRPRRNFGDGSRARLARVRAMQLPSEQRNPADGPAAPIVRYVSRDYPARLLAHTWNEYDDARRGLVSWLRALGDTALEDVCIHAGVAVGALARASFDHVFEEIVRPWALSGNVSQQDAAAVALQTIGADPRCETKVSSLLSDWAEASAEVSLQTTAARVYGSGYGAERPETTARVLTELAEREPWPVARAVAWSMSELIATKSPGTTERVFELLGEWVSSRKPLLRATAHLAFLFAAGDLVDESPRFARSGVKEPVFLQFDRDPRFAPIHRYLWIRVLNSPDMAKAAREVLTAWAVTADEEAEVRTALIRLLGELAAADYRAGSIVRLLARDWTSRAPLTAAAIVGRFD